MAEDRVLLPEGFPSDPEPWLQAYLWVLRHRGWDAEARRRRERDVHVFIKWLHDAEPDPCHITLRRFRAWLKKGGSSPEEMARRAATVREFDECSRRVVKSLTTERVEALSRPASKNSVLVPNRDDVHALLDAPDSETPEGLKDALAMHLAAYHGLSAQKLCQLRVGVVCPAESQPGVQEGGAHAFPIDAWTARTVLEIAQGRSANEPAIATAQGRPMTPPRLRQRVSKYVDDLGDELRERLTLERLRDHAACWMLDHGRSLSDVAKAFGYTRVASARRRYGSEAWAYLADREGNWFSAEAAAEAEGRGTDELRKWAEDGMRHEVRATRVYVRKEDVREFAVRPQPTPRRETAGGGARDPVSDTAEKQATKDLKALFGAGSPEDLRDALTRLGDQEPQEVDGNPRELLAALTTLTREPFLHLGKLRQNDRSKRPSETRVGKALKTRELPPLIVAEDYVAALRSGLMWSSEGLRFLDLLVPRADLSDPGCLLRVAATSLLNGPSAVAALCDALSCADGQWAFWLLVDHYWDELVECLKSTRAYYGVSKEDMEQVGIGCLLYAFLVGVALAHPQVNPGSKASAQTPQQLMLEALTQWHLVLLNAAAAVPKGGQGGLLVASLLTHISDDGEFMRAFEQRWRATEEHRRGPWSFRVVAAVSVWDIIRYQYLLYSERRKGDRQVSQAATNHILYAAKLPPERLMLGRVANPSALLRYVLCLLLMPLADNELRRAVIRLATAMGQEPEGLVDLLPADLYEQVHAVLSRACESFDFSRGTTEGQEDCERTRDAGTSFTSYVREALRRFVRKVMHEVSAEVLMSGQTGDDLDDGRGRPAVKLRARRSPEEAGRDDGTAGGSRPSTEPDEWDRPYSPLGDALVPLPTVVGPNGQAFVTTCWAALAAGKHVRWVQRHVAVLEAKRASDVLDRHRLLDLRISDDAWLIPYGSQFHERVKVLCEQRSSRNEADDDR